MQTRSAAVHSIKRLLREDDPTRAGAVLERLDAPTGAAALAAMPAADAATLLRQISEEHASEILGEMDDTPRGNVLSHLEADVVADLVRLMPSDDGADVLQDMPAEDAEQVLAHVDRSTRSELRELVSYGDDSAGGLMAKELAALPARLRAGEALEVLRRDFSDVEHLNVIFALDEEERLIGSLSLRDLVFAAPETPLTELVERHRHWAETHEDQEDVVHYMRRHDLDALPVVDDQHQLVGQITLDDAVEVMDEEAAEDLASMVGVSEEETVFGPLAASIRRRLPWLLVNVPLAMLAATIVSRYEDTVAKAAVLVVFLPIIGGMAGNAAGQTLAVFIRGLAVREVTTADTWRAAWRQLLLSWCLGLILAALVGGVAWWWRGSLVLAGVVGVAMLLNCMTALLLGGLLPMLFRRLGFPGVGQQHGHDLDYGRNGLPLRPRPRYDGTARGLARVIGAHAPSVLVALRIRWCAARPARKPTNMFVRSETATVTTSGAISGPHSMSPANFVSSSPTSSIMAPRIAIGNTEKMAAIDPARNPQIDERWPACPPRPRRREPTSGGQVLHDRAPARKSIRLV